MSYYFQDQSLSTATKKDPGNQIGISDDFIPLLTEAYGLVGKLDGICRFVPNIDYYVKLLMMQEVCASCELENMPVRFYDFFDSERVLKDSPLPANLLNAIHYAHGKAFSENFIKRLHGILTTSEITESQYRNSQGISPEHIFFSYGSNPVPSSWIGNAVSDIEKYISSVDYNNALTSAAKIQYQLEILNPFSKYNRVIARIIAVNMLKWGGLTTFPALWLSCHLLNLKIEYKDRITAAYRQGEELLNTYWIRFFLMAVIASAKNAIHFIEHLATARQTHAEILPLIGNGNKSIQMIYDYTANAIIVNVSQIADSLQLSFSSISKVVKAFETAGVLRQVTQKERYRQFGYVPVLDLIEHA